MSEFSSRILKWFDTAGRHELPWQIDPSPYRVWVSEIMLQQTQVKTVIPYYLRFLERFPDINHLADAELDEVLHLWSGLGYYARARNLHKSAITIIKEHKGKFPCDIESVIQLPGIGKSTAGAILSLSMKQRHPILDGNVKRVLTRHRGIEGWPGEKKIEDKLWRLAEELTPARQVAAYTQAVMDLGATVCTRSRPTCSECPVMQDCFAYQHNQQSVLPSKRIKKSLPVKKAIFTIIKNKKGEVLLEKRPPVGIWGGLWSLPECPIDENVTSWIENQFGVRVSEFEEKNNLRHTFSHFHLDILPVQVTLKSISSVIKDNGEIYWYKPENKLSKGIATPVAKLLKDL